MNISVSIVTLNDIGKMPVLDVIILCIIIIVWIVGWICTIIDVIISLIECYKCDRRKRCDFLIFSEYCPKRYCLNEEERKQIRAKIKELDDKVDGDTE